MKKRYKVFFLAFGLMVLNLATQAQVNPYATVSSAKNQLANLYQQSYFYSVATKPEAQQVFGFINYPNPAITYTTIAYTLSDKANVVLRVIDLAGKQMALLVKQEQSAGKHNYYWELSKDNIEPGMYIIILQVDSQVYSRKMIVQ